MFEKNENVQSLIKSLNKLNENEVVEYRALHQWLIENKESMKLLLEDYSKVISDNVNFVFSSEELSDKYKSYFRFEMVKFQSFVNTVLNLEKACYYMKNKSFFMDAIDLPYNKEDVKELSKMLKENEPLYFTYENFFRNCSYKKEDMDVPQFIVKCSFTDYSVFKFNYSDFEGVFEFSRKYEYLYNTLLDGNTYEKWI
jgi:hypothetical protein